MTNQSKTIDIVNLIDIPETEIRKSRFVSLRFRYILISSSMLLLLLSSITLVLLMIQSRTIKDRMEKQGLAVAGSIASVSIEPLLTYNYVALEKLANQSVTKPDIISVVIHDKEGRIAGFSDRPDLQHQILNDEVSLSAIKTQQPLITVHIPGKKQDKVMDIALPVYLNGTQDRWGTVRVRLSLELMAQQFKQTIWSVVSFGVLSLVTGVLISNWAAQRVTRPLQTLVEATIQTSKGKLDPNLSIRTGDEVEILAANFSSMIREILRKNQESIEQLNEIRKLQQYTEGILDTMNDGLLVTDMKGRIAEINPAARVLLKFSEHLVLRGKNTLTLFESYPRLSSYINQALENPEASEQTEVQFEYKNEARTFLINSSILDQNDKTGHQIIFNLIDITELKNLEAGIRQAQRLSDIGMMAAGLAHDIRNPLSAIKTFVALLPQKIDRPGFLDKFQQTVPREINRLDNRIEEILELSRKPKFDFQSTDILILIHQCYDLLETDFQHKGIEIIMEMPDKLPMVMCDADQMVKVFVNLMQNSAQAMHSGGKIFIRSFTEKAYLIIIFEDNGPGFSQELEDNIFNPFFTTKAKGTGLGLAISHKIISEHQGQIEAKNLVDKGCRFTIRLPLKNL